MLRRLSACIAGLALLGGCGGGGGETADTQPQAAAGLTTHEVGSAGFAAAVPESWSAAGADDAEVGDDVAAALRRAPTLRPYFDALREPGSLLKFIAFDPEVRDGFATNLNVVVEPLPAGMTLEKYAETFVTQLQLVPVVVGDVEREDVELPAGEAVKAAYELKLTAQGKTTTVSTLQYAIVAERAAYVLTYTTLPSLAAQYADTFADSARSFRLVAKG